MNKVRLKETWRKLWTGETVFEQILQDHAEEDNNTIHELEAEIKSLRNKLIDVTKNQMFSDVHYDPLKDEYLIRNLVTGDIYKRVMDIEWRCNVTR